MNPILRSTLIAVSIAALTAGATGCKRVDNTSKDTMSSGSSGVMSNPAVPSGTAPASAASQ
ncbi:MAG TPA: hypothetical protein VEN30_32300 [Paraburkholderia sp.]|nr:hypothetical protein [Paraburkholderia sp.]